MTEDFATRYITQDCTINEYLKRPIGGQERTLHQLLLKRFSSAPYVEQLCDDAGMTPLEEYVIGTDICKGLSLAFLWDIPALSLEGDARFVPPYAKLTRKILNTADESISEEECQVGLICREDDIPFHEKSIKATLRKWISTGKDLLDYARQNLRYLVFSSVAEEQLTKMKRGHILLRRILSILEELQRAIQESLETQKKFSPKGYKYTPTESNTATQGKNAQKHTFTFSAEDADKSTKHTIDLLCESHMHITEGDRIYFTTYTDKTITKVYIVHIGEHLPGKKFRG